MSDWYATTRHSFLRNERYVRNANSIGIVREALVGTLRNWPAQIVLPYVLLEKKQYLACNVACFPAHRFLHKYSVNKFKEIPIRHRKQIIRGNA